MSMEQAKPISEVVGKNLRTWREEAELTQSEVARAAGELGFSWRQSTVAAIENGRREVSLGEFLALPFIVNRLAPNAGGGRFLHLAGLLQGGGTDVALSPDTWLHDPTNNLQGLVRSGIVGVEDGIPAGAVRPRPGVLKEIPERVEGVLEAEGKAARSLAVSPMEIRAASHRVWGRSLTDEREARLKGRVDDDASPRSLQAHRGHVTRELLAELEEVLPEKEEENG